VSFPDRQFATYTQIDFGVQAMARPAQAYFRNVAHAAGIAKHLRNFVGHFGISAIQQPGKNRFS